MNKMYVLFHFRSWRVETLTGEQEGNTILQAQVTTLRWHVWHILFIFTIYILS